MATENSITNTALPIPEGEVEIKETVNEEHPVVETTAAEECVPVPAEPMSPEENELSACNKEQLLARLAELVAEEQVQNVRQDVEQLKVAFYKLHRAEYEARRAAEAGGAHPRRGCADGTDCHAPAGG